MPYTARPLDASTWDAFAELVERNNGVFGGCWCMGFHLGMSRTDAAHNRAGKECRVREGRARAALRLFDLPLEECLADLRRRNSHTTQFLTL